MARSDVKDSAKHAGAVLGHSAREIAATAREQAGPVSEAVSAAMSAAADSAAERGRDARKVGKRKAAQLQKEGRKRAAELQKQASKQAKKASKKSSKKKRGKGKVLAVLGGCGLAAYAIVTSKKKQAERSAAADAGPRTPDTDPT